MNKEQKMITKEDLPEPDKYTYEELRRRIVSDGLDYCIIYGLSAESMPDEKLAELWKEARDAYFEVDEYLEEKLGEDYEWEK